MSFTVLSYFCSVVSSFLQEFLQMKNLLHTETDLRENRTISHSEKNERKELIMGIGSESQLVNSYKSCTSRERNVAFTRAHFVHISKRSADHGDRTASLLGGAAAAFGHRPGHVELEVLAQRHLASVFIVLG